MLNGCSLSFCSDDDLGGGLRVVPVLRVVNLFGELVVLRVVTLLYSC